MEVQNTQEFLVGFEWLNEPISGKRGSPEEKTEHDEIWDLGFFFGSWVFWDLGVFGVFGILGFLGSWVFWGFWDLGFFGILGFWGFLGSWGFWDLGV